MVVVPDEQLVEQFRQMSDSYRKELFYDLEKVPEAIRTALDFAVNDDFCCGMIAALLFSAAFCFFTRCFRVLR